MLGNTPNDVISKSKKLFVLLSNMLFTAGDIFGSFIRQPNSRSFLAAISDSTEFSHNNARSRGSGANLGTKKIFLRNQDWQYAPVLTVK